MIAAYSEQHRRYHGLSHLTWLLNEEERRAGDIQDRMLVQAAAWFHDAIYDPERPDNEARSAEWASAALTALRWPAARVTAIYDLIVKTKHHAQGEASADEALFLDMDIAILGASWERYCAYAAGVRAEYAHIVDPAFAAGRGAFLQSQLDLPRLFRTDLYESELAATARANMRWEMEEMRKGRMVRA